MSDERAVHASESGHWYKRDGTPCYQVPAADGKRLITPDVRHARKLGLVPGVTTITSCAAAPALTDWKVMQGIMSSLTLTRRPHEPDVEYIRRIIEDSRAQAKAAADFGTNIHAAVECRYQGRAFDPKFTPFVEGVAAEIERLFGKRKWIAEHSFACPLGFGSKIDLHALGPLVILDLKGKEFAEAPTPANKLKFHYDEHAMQLGAYRMALEARTAVCGNVFFSRSVPGLVHIHLWESEDLDRGWEQFKALLRYWQVTRKYDSTWREVEGMEAVAC